MIKVCLLRMINADNISRPITPSNRKKEEILRTAQPQTEEPTL